MRATIPCLCLVGAALLSAPCSAQTSAPDDAELYVISPRDSAKLRSPVTVRFGLKHMGVTHAGDTTPNMGHHHLLVDVTEPIHPTEPIPSNKRYLHFGAGQTETQLDLPSMDRATGWMRGQVIFDHTTLSEAVAELNRYGSPLRLLVEPSAAQIKVGGSFRIGDSESFARAVAETYNLSLTRRGNQLILRRPDSSLLRDT